ncbi:MAG: hypothetical protein ACKO7R_02225 [Pseudanabaena sp.]
MVIAVMSLGMVAQMLNPYARNCCITVFSDLMAKMKFKRSLHKTALP